MLSPRTCVVRIAELVGIARIYASPTHTGEQSFRSLLHGLRSADAVVEQRLQYLLRLRYADAVVEQRLQYFDYGTPLGPGRASPSSRPLERETWRERERDRGGSRCAAGRGRIMHRRQLPLLLLVLSSSSAPPPEDLNPRTSELEVGRSRGVFIPTTPWCVDATAPHTAPRVLDS